MLLQQLRNLEAKLADLFSGTQKVYTPRNLRALISEHRGSWSLPKGTKLDELVEALEALGVVESVELRSKAYTPIRRYRRPDAGPHELAVSLRPHSFISHRSAAELHGLVSTSTKLVVVNKEQSKKQRSAGALTQQSLDRAFARPQRRSKYVYTDGMRDFLLLNGKHTGRFEVTTISVNGVTVPVTTVERTMVELCVRPDHVGGVHDVLMAFRSAVEQGVSPDRVREVLTGLDYIYPYHQALGFFFSRAGASVSSLRNLRAVERNLDFYVCHSIKNAKFDEAWRVYYPAALDAS